MKQREGYLMVDHRASPGIPEDVARQIGMDPAQVKEGKLLEAATLTCSHCKNTGDEESAAHTQPSKLSEMWLALHLRLLCRGDAAAGLRPHAVRETGGRNHDPGRSGIDARQFP